MKTNNRSRNIRIVFYVDEKEADLIKEKMACAGILNREAYLRKMSLDGYVVRLDLTDVRKMVAMLSSATNNLNQIAKRVNGIGSIFKSDVADMQARYDRLWDQAEAILRGLAKI